MFTSLFVKVACCSCFLLLPSSLLLLLQAQWLCLYHLFLFLPVPRSPPWRRLLILLCPPTSSHIYPTSILRLRCAPPLHMLHLTHTNAACNLDDPAVLLRASASSSFFYLLFALPKEKQQQQHQHRCTQAAAAPAQAAEEAMVTRPAPLAESDWKTAAGVA
jgi:hypothetical protein